MRQTQRKEMMTKQHFEAIAATIHQQLIFAEKLRDDAYKLNPEGSGASDCACAEVNCLTDTAEALATTLAKYNTRFDRQRFLSACGLDFSEAGAMSTSDGLGA